VDRQPMSVAPSTIRAWAGTALNNVVVGTLSAATLPRGLTARIDWGDGSEGTGAFSGAGPFLVRGSHTYGQPGSYSYQLTVMAPDGAFSQAVGSVTVLDPVILVNEAISPVL